MTVSTNGYEAKVVSYITRYLKEDRQVKEMPVITRASKIADLFDSLDKIEIIMDFEKEYEINIPEEEADRWKNVGDIVSFIERKAREKKANQKL